MELAGDEKRIQALFSELSLRDAQATPDFGKLWREASVKQRVPARFSKALAVVVATLIVAVTVLFVVFSRDKSPNQQNVQNIAPQPIPSQPSAEAPEADNKVTQRRAPSHAHRPRTLARRSQRERALEQQAAMLANWKSPTEKFMTSPAPSVFNALPQLNESVKDLESFLPKNESLKESNQ